MLFDCKKKILVIVLFFIASLIPAQQFQLSAGNITFQHTGTEGAFILNRVNFPGAVPFTILTEDHPGEYEKSIIKMFAEDILNWRNITVKSIRIFFRDEHLEINVVPLEIIYNNKDYAEYLPAGLGFFHTDYTFYDFRLLVDNYFIRMRGQYFDQQQMLERMELAAADPVKYIASHDPEYIIKQISEINLEAIKAKGEINQLRDEIEKLSARYEILAQNHENLRYSYIGEIRNRLFGKKEPVPQEDIDAVLETRKNNPSATVDEIYSLVSKQGIRLSKGKVTVILNAYLGVY